MITKNTVLILGAGASRAYGFPLGAKLKAMIWDHYDNLDPSVIQSQYLSTIYNICKNQDIDRRTIERFNNALLLSPDYSIDSFLEHQCEAFKAIGKIGIAACLLPLEKRTYLYDDWMKIHLDKNLQSGIIFNDGHWYQYLFNKMSEGCGKFDDFSKNKLSIITFNYDRSLEYYLLQSLRAKYGRAIKECAEVLVNVNIIHVYGSLGDLPGLVGIVNNAVEYNKEDYDIADYQKAARALRIIPEERDTDPLLAKIWSKCTQQYTIVSHILKECPEFLTMYAKDQVESKSPEMQIIIEELQEIAPGIRNASLDTLQLLLMLLRISKLFRDAERIYFLGFGFIEDNMAKIFTEPGQDKYNLLKEVGGKCWGTAMGLSPHLKKKLSTIGLGRMAHDLEYQQSSKPKYVYNFPDSSIYDFLLHHPYSRLD